MSSETDLITEAQAALVQVGVFDGDDIVRALVYNGYSTERAEGFTHLPRLVRALLDQLVQVQQSAQMFRSLANETRTTLLARAEAAEKEQREDEAMYNATIRELNQQLAHLRAERAWQPIETAPKDGTPVLVYPGFEGEAVVVASWDRDPEDECGQCWRDIELHERISTATHWQPLPPPPITPEGSADPV